MGVRVLEDKHEDVRKTLRRAEDLVDEGLVERTELDVLRRVADRFDVARARQMFADYAEPGRPRAGIGRRTTPDPIANHGDPGYAGPTPGAVTAPSSASRSASGSSGSR